MSITVTTDVFCDDCGMDWVHGVTGSRMQTRSARRVAKGAGWAHRGGLDLCPKCVEGGDREPDDSSGFEDRNPHAVNTPYMTPEKPR